MKIENIQLADIKPFPKNAKLHPKEQIQQIKASIQEYGFNDPIAVSETNEIIEGHGRYIAVKELGYTEIPCIRLSHLTEAQRRAYILAHNKLTMNSGFDDEILLGEFDFLKDAGFGMELTGFDSKEIEKMFSNNDDSDVKEDDLDVDSAAEKPPFVMRGDIWTFGKHRLMCGDSTCQADVNRLMGGKKAQILWADPPWNVNYGKAEHPSWKRREIMNDSMSTADFYKFLHSAFTAMAAVSEAGAMVYIAMSAQEWPNVHLAMLNAGFHWSSTIIWAKDSLVLSRKDYHTKYEPLWYGWLDNGKRLCPLADRQQSDLWEIPRPKRSDEHPTMKPVELVAKSLINSSRKGDVVLDLFGGSGTTMIAAEQTDRVARLMELDPKYASVIVDRVYHNFPDIEITVKRDGNVLLYEDVVGD